MRNIADVVAAENEGRFHIASWRKAVVSSTINGVWQDLSMSPGNPSPNYYASEPLTAKALKRSVNGGIDHGGSVSGYRKFLKTFTIMNNLGTSVPLPLLMLDYLLYYPFTDMSIVNEPQLMDNTATLPRYTSGKGVMILPVEVGAYAGGQRFYVTYTNSEGITGRVTPTVTCNASTIIGSIASADRDTANSAGPFLPLQAGDVGVRAIESITYLGADVGLITLVLCKPIDSTFIGDINAPSERNTFADFTKFPEIQDDAYLNLLACPQTTLSGGVMLGTAQFVWG